VSAALLAAALTTSGCDALKAYLPFLKTPLKTASAKPTEEPNPNSIDPHIMIQLLTVSARGPRALGNGTRIIAERQDGTTRPDETSSPAAAFGLLQDAADSAEVPVQDAFIGIRGYDLKAIPQLPNRYTDEEGLTYFKYVPARIAFFLEAEVVIKGKTYKLLGLTRTPDEGLNSDVTIDIASTLVARELLRIWQMTDYRVSYKDLSPKDFNPLLATLRALFRGGMPDIPLDLSTVRMPDGEWSADKDREDSALVFLSKLAERQDQVNNEIDRIYQAVNYTLCQCRDDSKGTLKRPSPL
jgi:hypothetical protein